MSITHLTLPTPFTAYSLDTGTETYTWNNDSDTGIKIIKGPQDLNIDDPSRDAIQANYDYLLSQGNTISCTRRFFPTNKDFQPNPDKNYREGFVD